MAKRVVWHYSPDSECWNRVTDVNPRSEVGTALNSKKAGEEWNDGYGHLYKWLPADEDDRSSSSK